MHPCCTAAPKKRAGLKTIREGYPLQVVSVDIMGLLTETDARCKYVPVAVDYGWKPTESPTRK